MKTRAILVGIVTGLNSLAFAPALGAEPAAAPAAAAPRSLPLSPGVKTLLTAEMVEIAKGMQGLTLAIASADWAAIQATSDRIRESYIMEKKLTEAQAEELEQVLPERFKALDAEFHQRAQRLGAAAAAHDADLVVYHYSRLIESCTACHATYAGALFPGFSVPAAPAHTH
jgi:cytochrome c556